MNKEIYYVSQKGYDLFLKEIDNLRDLLIEVKIKVNLLIQRLEMAGMIILILKNRQ